jgi:hypothetical protein
MEGADGRHRHLFSCRDRLFPADAGKVVEEDVEIFSSLRYSIRFLMGTRVPANTGVPPMISGSRRITLVERTFSEITPDTRSVWFRSCTDCHVHGHFLQSRDFSSMQRRAISTQS